MGDETGNAINEEFGMGGLVSDLKAELEAQAKAGKSETGKPQMQTTDGVTDFALTLFFGLVVSAVGIAYIRYAKNAARPVMALAGVAMLVIPFVIHGPWTMVAAGLAVALLPVGLMRAGIL